MEITNELEEIFEEFMCNIIQYEDLTNMSRRKIDLMLMNIECCNRTIEEIELLISERRD